MRRSEHGWVAVCAGTEAESERLVEALRAAVTRDDAADAAPAAAETPPFDQWIRETAAHIVGDTLL